MKLSLEYGEALLVDWLLCEPMQNMGSEHLDWLIRAFGDLRKRLWEIMIVYPEKNPPPQIMEITEQEAKVLLAMVPTTFRWGSGVDCGLTLKTKVAMLLYGPDEDQQRATKAVEELLGGKQDAGSGSPSESPSADPEDYGRAFG